MGLIARSPSEGYASSPAPPPSSAAAFTPNSRLSTRPSSRPAAELTVEGLLSNVTMSSSITLVDRRRGCHRSLFSQRLGESKFASSLLSPERMEQRERHYADVVDRVQQLTHLHHLLRMVAELPSAEAKTRNALLREECVALASLERRAQRSRYLLVKQRRADAIVVRPYSPPPSRRSPRPPPSRQQSDCQSPVSVEQRFSSSKTAITNVTERSSMSTAASLHHGMTPPLKSAALLVQESPPVPLGRQYRRSLQYDALAS